MLRKLQDILVLLYDRTSTLTHVNKAKKALFTRGRDLEHIPPRLHKQLFWSMLRGLRTGQFAGPRCLSLHQHYHQQASRGDSSLIHVTGSLYGLHCLRIPPMCPQKGLWSVVQLSQSCPHVHFPLSL